MGSMLVLAGATNRRNSSYSWHQARSCKCSRGAFKCASNVTAQTAAKVAAGSIPAVDGWVSECDRLQLHFLPPLKIPVMLFSPLLSGLLAAEWQVERCG